MPSGAQLNRIGTGGGIPILTATPSSTAVAVNAQGVPTTYGTLTGAAPNDSGIWVTVVGFSKLKFTIIGGASGYSFTVLGTDDKAAYQAYTANSGVDGFNGTTSTPLVPWQSWVVIPGPSEQSGTGSIANPMTTAVPVMFTQMPWVAIRVVLTTIGTLSGNATVLVFGVP